jgi:hypothetical protein
MPNTRIEAVGEVERPVVVHQPRLRVVQMADVVFGRILRAPLIEDAPHLMLDLHRAEDLFYNVVLMKDVAGDEMALNVECIVDGGVNRQKALRWTR